MHVGHSELPAEVALSCARFCRINCPDAVYHAQYAVPASLPIARHPNSSCQHPQEDKDLLAEINKQFLEMKADRIYEKLVAKWFYLMTFQLEQDHGADTSHRY